MSHMSIQNVCCRDSNLCQVGLKIVYLMETFFCCYFFYDNDCSGSPLCGHPWGIEKKCIRGADFGEVEILLNNHIMTCIIINTV